MKFNNKDLENDIEKIKFSQESIENDIHKMAVSLESDNSLNCPFSIDIEDGSYFYSDQYSRMEDYELLVSILSDNSKRYFYF